MSCLESRHGKSPSSICEQKKMWSLGTAERRNQHAFPSSTKKRRGKSVKEENAPGRKTEKRGQSQQKGNAVDLRT